MRGLPRRLDVGCGAPGLAIRSFDNSARMNTWLNTGHKDVIFAGMREARPVVITAPLAPPAIRPAGNYYTTTVQNAPSSKDERGYERQPVRIV